MTALVIFLILEAIIYSVGQSEAPMKSDAIVVLGCELYGDEPSPLLMKRLEKALEIYQNGYGKYIITTGGQGKNETLPEGDRMKMFFIKNGISEDVVFSENTSTSTYENFKNIQPLLEEKQIDSIIIVTNDFHVFRSTLIARSLGYKTTGAPADSINRTVYLKHCLREGFAVVKFMVKGR